MNPEQRASAPRSAAPGSAAETSSLEAPLEARLEHGPEGTVPSLAGPGRPTRLGDGPGDTAPRRWTGATLTGGVVVSAACFLVAGAAELLGVDRGGGEMTDIGAIASGLVALTPWAWASLGTMAVVITPALGLLVTAWEYASVADRRTVSLALAVLGILVLSALVAVLR